MVSPYEETLDSQIKSHVLLLHWLLSFIPLSSQDDGLSDMDNSLGSDLGDRGMNRQANRPSRPAAGTGPRHGMYDVGISDEDDDEETLSSSNLSVVDDDDISGDDSDDILNDMAGQRPMAAGGERRHQTDFIDEDDGEF